MRRILSLLILLALCPLRAEEIPLEVDDAFLGLCTRIGDGTWEVIHPEGEERVLHLKKSGEPPEAPVRRPANLLMLPVGTLGEFQLDLEMKSTARRRPDADVILIFGFQDALNYTYAHISRKSDNQLHHVIMKVEGDKKIRTPIQKERNPTPRLNGKWQKVRLVRNADGEIQVYVDDFCHPTLTAEDATWAEGRIGIGSFNDPAMFRHLKIIIP